MKEELILYIIQSNLLLVGFYFAYQFFIRKQEKLLFSRIFLLGGIIFSFLSPLLQFNSVHFIENSILLPEVVINGLQYKAFPQEVSWNFGQLFLFIYFSIFLLLSLKLITQVILFQRLKAKCKKHKDYYLLPNSSIAISFFNVIIIGEKIPMEDRSIICEHEGVHSKNKHSFDIIICHLLEIIYFFNPLVFSYKKLFQEIHEFEADIIGQKNPENYIQLLLKQNFNQYELSFIHSFNSIQLKKRIMRISNQNSTKFKRRNILFAGALLSCVFIFNQQLNSTELGGDKKLAKLAKLLWLTEAPIAKSNGDVDKHAQFPGGQKALTDFMIKNVKYPKNVKEEIEGTVFVEFTVNKEGKITDYNIKRGGNEHLEKAAIAAIKKMPNWIPAEKDGKKVASKMVLPFKFVPKPPSPPKAPDAPKAPEAPKVD